MALYTGDPGFSDRLTIQHKCHARGKMTQRNEVDSRSYAHPPDVMSCAFDEPETAKTEGYFEGYQCQNVYRSTNIVELS